MGAEPIIKPVLKEFTGMRVKRARAEEEPTITESEYLEMASELANRIVAKYGTAGAANRLEISQMHLYNITSKKKRCSRNMFHKLKTLDSGGEASIVAIEVLSRNDIAALNIVGQALMDAGKFGALKALLNLMNRHDVAVAFEENTEEFEDLTFTKEQLEEQHELYLRHLKEYREKRATIDAKWKKYKDKMGK